MRTDVFALHNVIDYFKKIHLEGGPLKKYIIRRYISSMNGVLQIYSGCLIDSNFDVRRRLWFVKALEHTGKIVLTEPYLDAG